MKRLIGLFLLCMLCVAVPVRAERTDVVRLTNGDRVTCKIIQLDRGRLKVETDHMGTVYIDWTHIAGVSSNRNFEVEIASGETYYGELGEGESDGRLTVQTQDGAKELAGRRVVTLTEIKRGFFKRLDGSLEFGFNYKKADNDINYSIGANATYRTRHNETTLRYNSVLSDRDNTPRAFRSVVDGTYTHFLRNRWYVSGLARAEQNDQLDLDLRTALGGGFGRYLIQSNRQILGLAAGLTSNREQYFTDPGPRTSLEALATVAYDFFIHGDLGADISTHLTVFPSLTDSGRYRLEWDFKYRQEIVSDLFISFSGWYSFDNKAPVSFDDTVKQDDFGIVTSLGWDF